ncbi:MAG: YebC/PmpR family DNA-binding transcriptional regulator [Bacteroidetes bacterium]|nr:MAG: YebC/PmpR family DNA-binding transcriptional regulator [Bacteroidota bacterium]
MSGHSKWSTIKRKKGVKDARRSKVWARIARDIMTAARDGGGDPGMNPRLSLAIEKAKSENMPKDNIERAIKKGTGEIEGADYVEMTYEGYAASGIAVYVDALTDNTNRTVADIRSIFSKAGGSLGQNGSVAFLFTRKGVFEVPVEGVAESDLFELVADAGAEDLTQEGDHFVVTCEVEDFGSVQNALETASINVEEAMLQRIPLSTTLLEVEAAGKVTKLIEKLEDHQDVQTVSTNLEFDEALLEALS